MVFQPGRLIPLAPSKQTDGVAGHAAALSGRAWDGWMQVERGAGCCSSPEESMETWAGRTQQEETDAGDAAEANPGEGRSKWRGDCDWETPFAA